MKKNYFILALCLALAICVAFLLWPDKQHDTHADQHADMVAENDTIIAHMAQSGRIIDSLNKTIAQKDSANKSLLKGQSISERKLNAKSAEVVKLLAEIRGYNQDTGYFGHMLDSLEQQVQSLTFLITQYESYADSINNVNDSLKIGYDAVIKEKDKRIAELQSAYDKLFKAYKDLFDTSANLQKDLRRQKLKTKIAAVLGAAVGVLGLVK